MVGTRLSRYHILEQIGAGGMGVVYRARDERLERDVAIKVLSAGLLADEASRRRFRKEALALSQLSHPGIAVLHDFDTDGETDFLVMEYIPGATLDQRLASGPIPEPELARYAIQAAEGLAAAHDLGVIHRDLKPGNLRITPDGRLKILDFGLARVLDPAVRPGLAATQTEGHAVVGTLAYMAPEVLGGVGADSRSDVYSMGVVLYEMATGRAPFVEESGLALMYAVLNRTPPAPRTTNPSISPRLDAIILRAIDREPGRRYESARRLLDDLRDLAAAAEGSAETRGAPGRDRIESLAVLPLENLSGDPTQEFFADGMTEALIADLAKIGSLKVISRTSAMRFKGVRKPLPEIARELRVDAIVEGSVVRGGDRVRISAQLIDARSDTHLWGESYERALGDVLSLQSEVARAIAGEVRIKLSPQADQRLARTPRVDPAAFEAYLKGRYCWNRRTEGDLRRAADYFRQAIERDPGYALAHVGLADAFNLQGFLNVLPPGEAFPRARAAALTAVQIDAQLGEAHNSLAYARLYHDWDWAEAERGFRRALELSPGYSVAHQWYMNLLATQGRFDEALQEGMKARELDPFSVITTNAVGWMYFHKRDFERALAEMRIAMEIDPDFMIAHVWCSWPLLELGRYEEAISELERGVALAGDMSLPRAYQAYGLARAGRAVEARAIRTALVEQSATRYVSPYLLALIHVGLGEHEASLEWLERALADRSHWMTFLNVDQKLDPLRGDPRFEALRRQVGLAE